MAAGADIAPLLAEADTQRVEAARPVRRQRGPFAHDWLESAAPDPDVALQACTPTCWCWPAWHDDLRDVDVPADFVSSVVIDSGRATLVVPHIATAPIALKRVLVPGSPHASRRAPSPRHCRCCSRPTCDGVAFDEGDEAAAEAGIVGYLRLHGVQATFKREVAREHDLGAQLLSLAADEQSDLLVMGCYGHGRAREWALGGVTRSVLEAMTCRC